MPDERASARSPLPGRQAVRLTLFYLRHPSTPRYLAPEIYEATREGMAHVLEHAAEFLIHGETDTIIPIEQNSRRMYPLLQESGVPT